MSDKVSAITRKFWLDAVLAWAEERLMPPQFDECKRALTQIEPVAYAAAVAAERQRAAKVCQDRASQQSDTKPAQLINYSRLNEARDCAAAIQAEPAP